MKPGETAHRQLRPVFFSLIFTSTQTRPARTAEKIPAATPAQKQLFNPPAAVQPLAKTEPANRITNVTVGSAEYFTLVL
ncbi:MAG: hypothetical protein FWG56_10040 [Desulfovibrionaceae bacterium]|jgi:hypothetical protein|nr:hypothetical protein [Desulfovibrionaceae bacterium]